MYDMTGLARLHRFPYKNPQEWKLHFCDSDSRHFWDCEGARQCIHCQRRSTPEHKVKHCELCKYDKKHGLTWNKYEEEGNQMPVVLCRKCGRKTNTALSSLNDMTQWGKYADRCFIAVKKDGTAVKGCAYDEADRFEKKLVDRYLKSQPWK